MNNTKLFFKPIIIPNYLVVSSLTKKTAYGYSANIVQEKDSVKVSVKKDNKSFFNKTVFNSSTYNEFKQYLLRSLHIRINQKCLDHIDLCIFSDEVHFCVEFENNYYLYLQENWFSNFILFKYNCTINFQALLPVKLKKKLEKELDYIESYDVPDYIVKKLMFLCSKYMYLRSILMISNDEIDDIINPLILKIKDDFKKYQTVLDYEFFSLISTMGEQHVYNR